MNLPITFEPQPLYMTHNQTIPSLTLQKLRGSNLHDHIRIFPVNSLVQSYYAEHPGRSLLAGNDSLALSRLRVRILLLTSRTPPFDLIGWWYVSQSSHVDTWIINGSKCTVSLLIYPNLFMSTLLWEEITLCSSHVSSSKSETS